MKIHTTGDSHAWHAWLKIPEIVIHQVGPMTMYSMGINKPIVTTGIPTDAVVVYCWGEIDCRCHVHKYQPWKECIDSLVKNYLNVIKINQKTHPLAWIYNIVPPPRRSGLTVEGENPAFPFLGNDEERLSYVTYMNECLRGSGYPFIDIYKDICDEDGFLRDDCTDDHVHTSNEKPIIKWIEKNGIQNSQPR